jgi:tellurite resistance protein TerC
MTLALWITIAVVLLLAIVLELGILSRRPRENDAAESLVRFAAWFVLAAGAGVAIFFAYQSNYLAHQAQSAPAPLVGIDPAELVDQAHQVLGNPIDTQVLSGQRALIQFAAAYVTELVLSLDNILVFGLLIAHFGVNRSLAARALFWGVLGSLIIRLGLVLAGAELLRSLSWVHWVFAGLLVLAMLRTLLLPSAQTDMGATWLVRAVRRVLPIAPAPDDHRLTTRSTGRWMFTPVAALALCVMFADVSFAADSIPAAFAITRDPLIAFTASAMAIMALRSLYFALVDLLARFRYLKVTMVFVLLLVAVKSFWLREQGVPTLVFLGALLLVLGIGIVASIAYARLLASQQTTITPTNERPIDELAALATWRNIRKAGVLIAGATIVVVGVAIVGPLPGPGGIPVVAAGLGLLATEFVWAQRLLKQFRDKTVAMQNQADQLAEKANPWMVPVVIVLYWAAFWLAWWGLHKLDWPKTGNVVGLASFGMFIPVAYWAFKTLKGSRKAPKPQSDQAP